MKICIKCKKEKPLAQFWRRRKEIGYFENNTSSYCKECQKENQRKNWKKSYVKNPEKHKGYAKKWYQKHREDIKKIVKVGRDKLKIEVLTHYSREYFPKCNCCSETEVKFLTIDHINNNGGIERRELNRSGGGGFYSYLRKNKYPKGYQVLCFNCNMAKALYGKCPHKD